MEIKQIPLNKIQLNDWNPNTMSQVMFSKLLNSIKTKGIQYPIIVMKDKRKFVVIDGEHRLTIARQLNYEKIDCIVLDNMPRTQAMMLNRHINIIKGEDDDSKLNDFLRDLNADIDIDSIINELPYAEDEVLSILDVKLDDGINPDEVELADVEVEEKEKEEKITIRLKVPVHVYDKWLNLCEAIKMDEGDLDLKPEKIFEIIVNKFE